MYKNPLLHESDLMRVDDVVGVVIDVVINVGMSLFLYDVEFLVFIDVLTNNLFLSKGLLIILNLNWHN